ncbi:MAG TPA: folylpolyglutamate synthase/dihydrofolate synthase family protein [Bacteroidales bacterium]|nr:folylpolyglutamate synthase/dihydrofolate synthase family protein [Bacteroidales bacterium]
MNYSQSLEYIFSQLPMFHRIGAAAYKPDLGNITELCRSLGNPQHQLRTIHVAGTNGKGSVSHMLASILQEAGLKTGLFTSPHLKDFRERIRIDGRMIPRSKVASFITRLRTEFEHLHPSFFEMTTALAFEYFREENTDIAVIETGLGGRLDSTNVITPVVSVITNISFDHMQFLGDTLEKIALEKAGIIKPSVPVVIGETQPETEPVFRHQAAACGAPVLFADQLFTATPADPGRKAVTELDLIVLQRDGEKSWHVSSPLPGIYQEKNIITVMGVVSVLRAAGYPVTDRQVVDGIGKVIRNTGLSGRWQVLGKKPLTICDTGHNEGGLRYVLAQIAQTPHQRLHFVFGAVSDKDLKTILKMLPSDATYYFCKANVPRGMNARELAQMAHGNGLKGNDYPSVKQALAAARQAADDEDLIFVGGSTFVVAEVV